MVGKCKGVKGVDFHKNKWRARINVDGKRVEIGYYETNKEAERAIKLAQSTNAIFHIPDGYIRHPKFESLYVNRNTKDIMRLKNGELVSLENKKGSVEYTEDKVRYRHSVEKILEECSRSDKESIVRKTEEKEIKYENVDYKKEEYWRGGFPEQNKIESKVQKLQASDQKFIEPIVKPDFEFKIRDRGNGVKEFDVFEPCYGVREIPPEEFPDVEEEMRKFYRVYSGTPLEKMPFWMMLEFEKMLMKTSLPYLQAFLKKYPQFERFRRTVTDVLNYKEQRKNHEETVSKINSMKILMADCFKDFANRIDERLDAIESKIE